MHSPTVTVVTNNLRRLALPSSASTATRSNVTLSKARWNTSDLLIRNNSIPLSRSHTRSKSLRSTLESLWAAASCRFSSVFTNPDDNVAISSNRIKQATGQPHPQQLPLKLNTRSMYSGKKDEDFLFRQLLEYKSYTYTYLLADLETNEAVLIDPVIETVERDVRIVRDLGLNLVYGVNTHVHADHITGTGELKKRIPTCQSMIAEVSTARADIMLKEGDKIPFGKFELEVRSTPGHTNGCLSYVWHEKEMVFTGDALLIRGCGRTDFQQGSADTLYDSVHKKILSLPQHFRIFPAHDYTGQMSSTVGEELRFNPRLTKPKQEFVDIMKKLNLPYPKQIDKALPANLVCGVYDSDGNLAT